MHEFSSVSLSSSVRGLGAGAEERPMEVQYQDEFYRACYSTLDCKMHLTPEWTGSSSGRVDIQIKSLGWAIACVREGDRLEEHIARFRQGGRHYQWIKSGDIQDYILLDFRKSKPVQVKSQFCHHPCIFGKC
jgi:hypothetical protein